MTPITKSSLYIGERFSVPFSDPSHNYNRRDLAILGQDKMSLNVFYSTRIEERLSEGDH